MRFEKLDIINKIFFFLPINFTSNAESPPDSIPDFISAAPLKNVPGVDAQQL